MKVLIYSIVMIALFSSCASVPMIPVPNETTTIDYSNLENWAAHLDKEDPSDLVPKSNSLSTDIVELNDLEIDVFFVHPTTYTRKAKDGSWNADLNNEKLNKQTDKSTIQYQASIFNQVGRVYAPRYRQAHIQSFYTEDSENGRKALRLAYADVVEAFQYYLDILRQGRPFIIASHSQGTVHATSLIKDFIDGQSLQKDFIAAYLIGMPIEKNEFQNIPVCENPTTTDCFVSWRTYKEGYSPDYSKLSESVAVVNPLSWNTSKNKVGKKYHQGAILKNFNKPLTNIINARIHNGMLWTNKPKFPWSFLFNRKNYHIADMNFFYFDIQQNARERVSEFLSARRKSDKY